MKSYQVKMENHKKLQDPILSPPDPYDVQTLMSKSQGNQF